MCVYIYIYVCVCMYECIYTHIHTNVGNHADQGVRLVELLWSYLFNRYSCMSVYMDI